MRMQWWLSPIKGLNKDISKECLGCGYREMDPDLGKAPLNVTGSYCPFSFPHFLPLKSRLPQLLLCLKRPNALFGPLMLTLILFLTHSAPANSQFLSADQPEGGIRINQIGYGTLDPKTAIVDSDLFPGQPIPPFYIIALNQSADTVYTGHLQPTGIDIYSGKKNLEADFTKFTREGHYYLSIPGQGTSYPFVIARRPFKKLLSASLKAYYYNRASMEIKDVYGGDWARKEGHPDSAVLIHPSAISNSRPDGTVISAPGGWYDAGDYNKYIVNAAITMNTLFCAFEEYPALFQATHLAIPGSSKLLPDILNELLYNLRWMLCMQDPVDGGVYHKLTTARFDPMEMPSKDHAKRYVVQKSTAATLDFVAVMSTAAKILAPYKEKFPGLTDSLKKAALLAWNWAQAHPETIYDQTAMNKKFKPRITTGTYGDKNLGDEWYLAACSMLRSTLDPKYLPAVEKYSQPHTLVPTWSQVAVIGSIYLIKIDLPYFLNEKSWSAEQRIQLKTLQMQARKGILSLADQLIQQVNPGFKTVMGGRTTDYNWGSNSNCANQGWILMEAFRYTHLPVYRKAAIGNLDYLLGKNPTGYCFVTGFGTRSPMHPHHRISISDKVVLPVPGWLVGGPNPGRQDGVKGYSSDRADLSYLDDDQAYSVNEVAINWNAPLVYLLTAIEATGADFKNN